MTLSDQEAPKDPEEYEKWAEEQRQEADKYYDRQDATTGESDDGDGWSSDDDWGHDDSADSSDGHGN